MKLLKKKNKKFKKTFWFFTASFLNVYSNQLKRRFESLLKRKKNIIERNLSKCNFIDFNTGILFLNTFKNQFWAELLKYFVFIVLKTKNTFFLFFLKKYFLKNISKKKKFKVIRFFLKFLKNFKNTIFKL